MVNYFSIIVLAIALNSCSTTDVVSPDAGQTWRIYKTSPGTLFDAIHRFGNREHFAFLRLEQEAGRVLGEKTVRDTLSNSSRVVLMAMAITRLDSASYVIDVRFNYANERKKYSPQDEQALSGYLRSLFGFLDKELRPILDAPHEVRNSG
ncbi:MAG TPA: hypothetical protein VI758_11205 [Bacteroidota bacterium]